MSDVCTDTCTCRHCGAEYSPGLQDYLEELCAERDEARAELERRRKTMSARIRIVEMERDEARADADRLREGECAADAEIARLRDQVRWIPVEERLPEKDGVYAAKLRGAVLGRSMPASWWAVEFFADDEHPEWYGVSSPVTHWMALPDLQEGT